MTMFRMFQTLQKHFRSIYELYTNLNRSVNFYGIRSYSQNRTYVYFMNYMMMRDALFFLQKLAVKHFKKKKQTFNYNIIAQVSAHNGE